MKALSFKQPWAWLMVNGHKDIENRGWKLPATMFGKRIYVHTGKKFDYDGFNWICANCFQLFPTTPLDPEQWARLAVYHEGSVIVGEIDLIDCVTESDSQWFFGPYGFTVANPVAYEKPIPCKGMLGFFEVENSLLSL